MAVLAGFNNGERAGEEGNGEGEEDGGNGDDGVNSSETGSSTSILLSLSLVNGGSSDSSPIPRPDRTSGDVGAGDGNTEEITSGLGSRCFCLSGREGHVGVSIDGVISDVGIRPVSCLLVTDS